MMFVIAAFFDSLLTRLVLNKYNARKHIRWQFPIKNPWFIDLSSSSRRLFIDMFAIV